MRIVILGGGYAGLTLARQLERRLPTAVDLVLVDDTGTHVVRHELHRLIRRPGLEEDLEIPLRDLLDWTTIKKARVTTVDVNRKEVHLENEGPLEYDIGAVCLGAEPRYFGMDDVADHATPLWTMEGAESVRSDFLDVLENGGRTVVGGAGLTGVQVAGELAALATEEEMPGGESGNRNARILLLEQRPVVAPGFREDFQEAIRSALDSSGVEVRTDTTVTGATADAIEIQDGDSIEYDQLVWTGGIRGPDAMGGERRTVRSDLRLKGETFVLGDAGQVIDADGQAVSASAQAAIREAKAVATNVERLVDHADDRTDTFEPRLESFTFEPTGWLVSVGDEAVAQVGPTVLTGAPAKAVKATVGAGYRSVIGDVRNATKRVTEDLDPGVRS